MKRILLSWLLAAIILPVGFCQAPSIELGSNSIEEELSSSDTMVVKIPVTNNGNRDLIYNVSFIGRTVEFTKVPYSDWEVVMNQDLITPDLIITRADDQGIYNIATESYYSGSISPYSTLWALGESEDLEMSDYDYWRSAVDGNPPQMLYQTISMYDDLQGNFYDFDFNSWSEAGSGGGFSYSRNIIISWLYALDEADTILPSTTDTLAIVIDARIFNVFQSEAYIIVESNDSENGEISIPVSLTITDGTAEIETTDTEFEFETTPVGATGSVVVPIWNIGDKMLTISGMTNMYDAIVPSIMSSDVGIGSYEYLVVKFSPDTTGTYMDTIVLATNDPGAAEYKIAFYGMAGDAADISVTPTSSTKTVNYGEDLEYGDYDTTLLIISNTGDGLLEYTLSVRVPGAEVVYFEKEDNADFSLAENQDQISENVAITRGANQGIYNIATEGGYSRYVSPEGTLWYDGLTIESMSGDHEEGIYSAFGSLGDLPGNTLSMEIEETEQFFDVTFLTWSAITGGGFSYERIETVNWLKASHIENSVASGDKDTVLIFFYPSDYKETYDAEVVISTNVPDKEEVVVPFNYTVTGPAEMGIYPENLDFGGIVVGASTELTFTVSCWGADTLEISSMSTAESAFSVDHNAFNVLMDSTEEVTITFAPTMVQAYKDTIVITSNAVSTPIVKIPLTGTGLDAPDITLNTTSLSTTVESGNSTVDTLVIINDGDGMLYWNLEFIKAGTEPVEFTKDDWADPDDEANQDRVTDNLWITRGDYDGLFNAATESSYSDDSPDGVLWYDGYTYDASSLTDYETGLKNVYGSLSGLPGNTLSMYVSETKAFYDIYFNEWTSGRDGGGFSYIRTETVSWISSNTSGSILSGERDTLILYIDASEVYAGTYEAVIAVNSNDPDEESSEVSYTLTVTGEPEITINDTVLDFGDVFIGYPDSLSFTVINTGTAALDITSIVGEFNDFTVTGSGWSIPAMDSLDIMVTINASESVDYIDTLVVTSGYDGAPIIEVALSASGVLPPVITVLPESIDVDVYNDSSLTGEIYISNTGGSTLMWSLYNNSLESTLINLNKNYQNIIDVIPSFYNFSYDGGSNSISDGGDDMYDGANYLSTNLYSNFDYSDNEITSGDGIFGNGTSYYTRHLPGLFVLVADVNGISSFSITGNNGADGDGIVQGSVIEAIVQGSVYTGYLKRVGGTSDPSINHIIILERYFDATHDYSDDSNNDYHEVSDLSGINRLYYILYAGTSGLIIDDDEAGAILEQFIIAISGDYNTPNFMAFDSESDTTAAGFIDTIAYAIDLEGFAADNYSGNIVIESNDPEADITLIPINVQYGTLLQKGTIADTVVAEGFGSIQYVYSGLYSSPFSTPVEYVVYSSNTDVVTVALDGTNLTVTEQGLGTSTVTLRAQDSVGNVEFLDFEVKVNSLIQISNPISDMIVNEGFSTYSVDISDVFYNEDGDTMLYSVSSGTESVVTATIDGSAILLTEMETGSSVITLTAADEYNDSASDEFSFRVNAVPVSSGLADVEQVAGFGSYTIDLTSVFSDADTDALSYSSSSSAETVVTSAITEGVLTLSETGTGESTISVTASDGVGGEASDSFVFTNTATGVATSEFSDITIYPNPAIDQIIIQSDNLSGKIDYKIYNILGEVVVSNETNYYNPISIDISTLPAGLYHLDIISGNNIIFTEKLIITK